MDWKGLGASLAVAAACVGAFGWMLSGVNDRLNRIETELISVHGDVRALQREVAIIARRIPGGWPALYLEEPCELPRLRTRTREAGR